MLGSKGSAPASIVGLAVIVSFALVLAACTSTTFHWITPVATLDAVEAPAAETPEPVAENAAENAAVEATQEPEEVAATGDAEENEVEGAGETAAEATEEMGAGMLPRPIAHRMARHEVCSDCHAVDGSEAFPAEHVKYASDDICVYCHMPEEGPEAVPAQPDPAAVELCLTCHGPFTDLMAHTVGYVDPDGAAANPHVPVPHDKTGPLACKNCHEPHPLPVVAPEEIPQASIEFCYLACHHERNWNPCSSCHEGEGGE